MKKPRFHSCNLVRINSSVLRFWQFNLGGAQPALETDQEGENAEKLALKRGGKDWKSLWQQKLNIAWFPPERVYLRVAHLPAANESEVPPMVEMQLEKLSPVPVNQIVWSYQLVPSSVPGMKSVVVAIIERGVAEQFLGGLEAKGYLADQLELPFIHLLKTVPEGANGLWIWAGLPGAANLCFVAWWIHGVLQHLDWIAMPAGEAGSKTVIQHLTETAWAGEIEGWLAVPPECHLMAVPEDADLLAKPLQQWSGKPVQMESVPAETELAALSASALNRNDASLNLLPSEYRLRYHRQFVDRLWMGGLGSIVVVYLIGVFFYFAALQYVKFQKYQVDGQVGKLSESYTNTIRLKARVDVLNEQVNLRFAALECWRAACTLLPQGLTLTDLQLQQGKTLRLVGTVQASDINLILTYNQAMRLYHVGDEATNAFLFKDVQPFTQSTVGANVRWDFTCEIARSEVE